MLPIAMMAALLCSNKILCYSDVKPCLLPLICPFECGVYLQAREIKIIRPLYKEG